VPTGPRHGTAIPSGLSPREAAWVRYPDRRTCSLRKTDGQLPPFLGMKRGLFIGRFRDQIFDAHQGQFVCNVPCHAPVVRNFLVELFTLAAHRLTASFGRSAILSVIDNCRARGGDAGL